jgi:hypothetical protein
MKRLGRPPNTVRVPEIPVEPVLESERPETCGPPHADRLPRRIDIPIAAWPPWPTLTLYGAITDEQWERMLEVLASMRPALIGPLDSGPQEHPTRTR